MKSLPVVGLVITFLAANFMLTKAQVINQWAPQRPIPDYVNPRPPFMLADQNKTVHIFYDEPAENAADAFYYRQWSLAQGWTKPIDFMIVAPRTVPSMLQSVFLDKAGVVHLVYFGDLQEDGNIYYARGPVTEAGNATAWTKPILIGPAAGPVVAATIFGDGVGKLIVLYSGQEAGVGLYAVYSDDGGLTWSDPNIVTLIDQKNNWPYAMRMVLDAHGEIHAVWSLVNDAGVGTGNYYAALPNEQSGWTKPILLAALDPGDFSAEWPEIIVEGDQLIVVYQDSFPAAKFMRTSADRGLTWSNPTRPFPHIGGYENAVMVRDGDGVIHMFLGNRIGNPAIHGMWHSVWLGQKWSDLQPIASGPRSSTFDPSAPKAVVSQGNVLLVTWWNNVVNAGPAMYSYIVLNAAEEPIVPFPTPTPTPTITPTPTEAGLDTTLTPVPKPVFNSSPPGASLIGMDNPMIPVLIGVLAVLYLSTVVIVIHRVRRNSQR